MVSTIHSKMPSGQALSTPYQKMGMKLHTFITVVGVSVSLLWLTLAKDLKNKTKQRDWSWRDVRQGTLNIHRPYMYSFDNTHNKIASIKHFSCSLRSFIVSQVCKVCKQCATISRFYCSTNSKYFCTQKRNKLFTGFAYMYIYIIGLVWPLTNSFVAVIF